MGLESCSLLPETLDAGDKGRRQPFSFTISYENFRPKA